MKKSKFVLATLAATVFVASSGALVACGNDRTTDQTGTDDQTGSVYTITFDANGGSLGGAATMQTGSDGKLASMPADPTHTSLAFKGWYTAKTDGTHITTGYVFTADITIYAQWQSNGGGTTDPGTSDTTYTITFDAGEGAFGSGKTLEVTTGTDGIIPSYNMPLDPEKANSEFVGWVLNSDGTGDVLNLTTYAFTDDITVYAKYEDEELGDYLYCVGENGYANLSLHVKDPTDPTDTDTRAYEYQALSVDFTAEDVVTFYVKDEHSTDITTPVSFFVNSDSNGVEATTTSEKVTSVKILNSAKYNIYLKWYDQDPEDATKGNCFVLVITDGSSSGVTIPGVDIPDAPTVAMTKKGGEAIELKTTAITPPETAKYQYTTVAGSVQLTAGEVITLTIDGKAPPAGRFGMRNSSHGIEVEEDKVKVLVDGTFTLYLRYYEATATDAEWWEVEMTDGKTESLTDGAMYIVGGMNGWAAREAYVLNEGTITVDLKAGVEFKVATYKLEQPWTGANPSGSSYDKDKHIVWGPGTYSFGYHQVTADTKGNVVKSSDNNNDNLNVATTGKYIITVVGTAPGAEISIELFTEPEPEHTVTLNAGDGTLAGGVTSLKTNDKGRLAALPQDPTPPTGKVFTDWFTAETGGERVTLATKFTADATIYARYRDESDISENAVLIGGVASKELKHTAPETTDTAETQYAATGLALTKGNKISFNLDVDDATDTRGGKPVKFVINSGSKGIVVQGVYAEGTLYTEVTVDVSGTFAAYLKHYKNDGEKWVLYIETTAEDAKAVTGTEQPSSDLVAVDTETSGKCYMVGHFATETVDWDHGVELVKAGEQYNLVNYTLKVGDVIKFRESGKNGAWHGDIQDNCDLKVNFDHDDDGNLIVKVAGTYSFYVKTANNTDHPGQIWVEIKK